MSNADPPIRFPARQGGALHELGFTRLITGLSLKDPGILYDLSTRFEVAARYRRISVFVRYTAAAAGGSAWILPLWYVDGPGAEATFDDQRIDPATGQAGPDFILTPPATAPAPFQFVYSLFNPGGVEWLAFGVREHVNPAPNNGTLDLWVRAGG